MTKLLKTYFNKPTLENAQKIVAYNRKHPMAACMLTAYDYQIFQDAVAHARNTLNYPTQQVAAREAERAAYKAEDEYFGSGQ